AGIQENVTGIRVVKAFVREDFEKEKFGKAAWQIYRMSVKAEKVIAVNGALMMTVIYGTMILLSWFGAHFIVAGQMTTGNLTSLFSYVLSMLMSLMMVSMIFVMLTMSLAAARRITEVLEEKPDITNPENPVMDVRDGSIDFNKVDFAYRSGTGKDTLHDIDLHIKSGETIGIIGATGSGKTTLVNLISRLYDVTDGSVEVGGLDVRRYDMEVLRNQVSVVLQKNVLFSGTILDNLRWGNEDATEEQCREACRLACADEFIEQMPDGYNTWIEQGGTNVSGGQKQRLCIARALLKKPKVLILDDSTSAVDTATDARIRAAFRNDIPETTKLIISQRISSVQDADRIIVLENGAVDGFDTHENLLKNNEIYREICEVQMHGSGDFDEKING
ncbi:MAG: ABC transporter ATP-binding protein, partial [Spirochaetales bacterium]|nr:ABC transporter ATP-binding protein [Spirochaetales bacterium]